MTNRLLHITKFKNHFRLSSYQIWNSINFYNTLRDGGREEGREGNIDVGEKH